MSERISLPTPVLSAAFTDRRDTEGTSALLCALGEAIARQGVLDSLGLIRETFQGVKVVTELDAAEEARADADESLDQHIAEWDDLTKLAQEVKARDAAIEILSGMVARLIVEKPMSDASTAPCPRSGKTVSR